MLVIQCIYKCVKRELLISNKNNPLKVAWFKCRWLPLGDQVTMLLATWRPALSINITDIRYRRLSGRRLHNPNSTKHILNTTL